MNRVRYKWLLCLSAFVSLSGLAQTGGAAASREEPVFAVVGERVIPLGEYRQALAVATRKKYYHAKPPEAELASFQREVGDDVVNRVLLLAEAERRGIKPDRARLAATLADYEARYKGAKNWEANKDKMIAAVSRQLEADSVLEQLERQVRTVPAPSEKEALAYYEQNRSLFVEPEQVKLGVILLKVDPSSPQAAWNAAREEAQRVHARLLAGASFADLAQIHSGDLTANRGGDMGYVHRGMLPEAVHATVDALKVGVFSAPVQVLDGVAILRLDDRKQARQRAFADVRERAGDLWQRAAADVAWKRLIADLRRQTVVRVDESHFLPLPKSNDAARPR